MRSITRYLVVAALVGSFFMLWRAHTAQDVVVAQTRKPIMVTRIYTGTDGLSHAQKIEMKLTGNGLSDMMKVKGAQFSSRPAGPAGGWHTGPMRQFVINLSGRAELEVANGEKVPVGPGQIDLIEDTTGKGHITRNIEDRIVVTIPLEDQTVSTAAK
jgi:hypothetical protein